MRCLLEANTYTLDALEETLAGEAVSTGVLFCDEVTHLKTDRRLTLSDTDTDVTCGAVIEEWILERSISELELAHNTNLFSAYLTCVSVLLAETGRASISVTAWALVTEETTLASVTSIISEYVACTATES